MRRQGAVICPTAKTLASDSISIRAFQKVAVSPLGAVFTIEIHNADLTSSSPSMSHRIGQGVKFLIAQD
jgi:hypothetical protein